MEKTKDKQVISKRKWWFRCLKKMMKVRYKKPEFKYLGEEISTGGLIISNHEGTDAPMSFEIYSGKPVRFWGAYQMNSGLVKMYKYQSKVYFHEKKHWSLFGARMFCLIASPLTNLFYKGLNLISTYPDGRFKTTIKESLEAIKNGENIVVFPEKSDNGYQVTLDGFYGGFVLFAEMCKKNGIDLPIYVSYFNKQSKVYLVDAPILYSTLAKDYATREEITKKLCDRCNELGQMTYKMMEDDNTTKQSVEK
ncbi:MAG: hypothetical protein E7354_02050 [Clostridiales bacterium]|nr:hypothetical protein [Clostridiales bacterium]